MKNRIIYIWFLMFLSSMIFGGNKIDVVTTLSTYANIAKYIGGDKVETHYIVHGDQDAHFVRPKPSYAEMLSKADLFVSTGLDLELWAPTLVDMSKNNNIRSGQKGYVSASNGIKLLDKPTVLSRSQGGLHIYGNPHIVTNPLNFKIIAENITIGLEKVDPQNSDFYKANLKKFQDEIDIRTFGKPLVKLMTGNLLTKMANNGTLINFLSKKEFKGKKLISYLGGWLKEAMPFRGKKIVGYHKDLVYFRELFGVKVIGHVEPKPGIPPSPKHIEELVKLMRENKVKVLLAANYYDENKIKAICSKVGAVPVIVPMFVNGAPNTENVFKLTDYWISHLNKAFKKAEEK